MLRGILSRKTANPLFPEDFLRLRQATVYKSRTVEDLNCQVGSCFEVYSWLKAGNKLDKSYRLLRSVPD